MTFFDPLPRREAFESYRRTLNANRHCLQLRIFKPPSAADHEALHKVVTLAPDRGRISSWNLIADNVYWCRKYANGREQLAADSFKRGWPMYKLIWRILFVDKSTPERNCCPSVWLLVWIWKQEGHVCLKTCQICRKKTPSLRLMEKLYFCYDFLLWMFNCGLDFQMREPHDGSLLWWFHKTDFFRKPYRLFSLLWKVRSWGKAFEGFQALAIGEIWGNLILEAHLHTWCLDFRAGYHCQDGSGRMESWTWEDTNDKVDYILLLCELR